MGRHPEGPRLYCDPRTGIHYVRFTHAGKRHCVSTGTRDRGQAEAQKGPIYADTVKGRRRVAHVSAPVTPLEEVVGQWLADIESEIEPSTYVMYESYAGRFAETFPTLSTLTEATIADYRRARLREVKRNTLLKELCALRQFLSWCKEQSILDDVPIVEAPPKNVTGTADTKRPHKAKALKLTEAEAMALIANMPEWSRRGKRSRRRHRIRDFFIVAWETGLRPATIAKLSVPEHFKPGAAELYLPGRIDKARFERTVPLTAAAVEALARSAPPAGLIFGLHDYREQLANAASKALAAGAMSKDRADAVSKYDFRHGRTTHMVAHTKDLGAVAYLVGHRHVSTTSRYVEAPKEAAIEVLREIEAAKSPPKDPG